MVVKSPRADSDPNRKDKKMRKPVLFFILTTLVIASMACSGTMKGIDRYSGKRIYFTYQEEKFGSAELQVKMPDGELFIGRNIEESMAAKSNAPLGKEFPAVDQFQGNTEAFLFGDRGKTMRCKFRLSDTIIGFKSGGFGICETSDGHVVDIYTR
jgi:hypothetical protein